MSGLRLWSTYSIISGGICIGKADEVFDKVDRDLESSDLCVFAEKF